MCGGRLCADSYTFRVTVSGNRQSTMCGRLFFACGQRAADLVQVGESVSGRFGFRGGVFSGFDDHSQPTPARYKVFSDHVPKEASDAERQAQNDEFDRRLAALRKRIQSGE